VKNPHAIKVAEHEVAVYEFFVEFDSVLRNKD
jgi:hypothetical protein